MYFLGGKSLGNFGFFVISLDGLLLKELPFHSSPVDTKI